MRVKVENNETSFLSTSEKPASKLTFDCSGIECEHGNLIYAVCFLSPSLSGRKFNVGQQIGMSLLVRQILP